MSECFSQGGEVIRFSNAATELLYTAWTRLGETLARTEEERAALKWLCGIREQGVPGARAFPFDAAPPGISPPARLRFLAGLTAALAKEIAQDAGASIPQINWNAALQAAWLARLADLHEFIHRALPSNGNDLGAEEPLCIPPALMARVGWRDACNG